MADLDLVGMDGVSSSGFAALERLAPTLLGAGGLLEAQERLARAMLAAALERTSANYTRTAALLGVRRQAVQQMVTRFALEPCVVRLRGASLPRARTSLRTSLEAAGTRNSHGEGRPVCPTGTMSPAGCRWDTAFLSSPPQERSR